MRGWMGHIQDSEVEPLPAAEAGETELGSRPNLQAGCDPRRKFGKRQPLAQRVCEPLCGECAVLCQILSKRGILGGKDFCPAYAGRNGFPLDIGNTPPAYRARCTGPAGCFCVISGGDKRDQMPIQPRTAVQASSMREGPAGASALPAPAAEPAAAEPVISRLMLLKVTLQLRET